ncbi:DUF5058 family protein [Peptacetobacter sp.]|uniref:DUF5058 family protein n=1 Tax=Peptacetobacter sp. TaxID=2991975 RepID=UPI002F3F9302
MEKILKIANSPTVWVLCSIVVSISLIQAALFMRMAKKTAKEIELPSEVTSKAFRIGLISAIGPAMGVFIVMVGLMPSIGGPMAWSRLSIIGAAATELTAANLGAQAAGVELGGEGFTLTVMAVCWFVMALNGCGWLVVSGVFTPGLEKLRDKMSGGDAAWLAVLSGACSLGVFAYLNVNEIVKGVGNAIASVAGAISMVLLIKFVVPKFPKLMEYSLGIAMVIGICCSLLYDVFFI